MKYRELLLAIGVVSEDDRVVEKITTCHEEARPGVLFVAMKGELFDSNTLIDQVLQNGAMVIGNVVGDGIITVDNTKEALAVLAERFYGTPHRFLKVIGVTGTSGKSSVSFYIASLLRLRKKRVCMIGGDGVFMEERYLPTSNTTPSSLFLSRTLMECISHDIEYVVMEVSSHASEQGRIKGIFFDVVLFLNLGHDHLDYHSSFYQYKESKTKLLAQVKKDGVVLFCQEDRELYSLVEEGHHRVLRYGTSPSEYHIREIVLESFGSSFVLNQYPVRLSLLSSVNVMNVVAAIAACHQLGASLEEVCLLASQLSCLPGRLEVVCVEPVRVIVDYAHSVEAFLSLGQFVSSFDAKKWIVMGLGGERDKSKRKAIGAILAQYFDVLLLTSDNPRHEDPAVIVEEICRGSGYEKVEIELNRRVAITKAITRATNGDIILIAGKGNEKVQIIGEEQFPFLDKQEALVALEKRKNGLV